MRGTEPADKNRTVLVTSCSADINLCLTPLTTEDRWLQTVALCWVVPSAGTEAELQLPAGKQISFTFQTSQKDEPREPPWAGPRQVSSSDRTR